MILSLLLVSMISKSWAYSFINGFCKYEVISEDEQTVRLTGFDWCNYVPGTDINLSQFVTDESTNMTYELKEIGIGGSSCESPTTIGTLYIPVSVEKFDISFSYEYSSIIVAEGNPVYDSRNNCNAIIETATNKLVYGYKNTVIPSSVTSIGLRAFYFCSGLTSISIPSSVTSIVSEAFRGCSGLTSISIPSSVTSIGYCAFESCSGLTTITVDADNPVYDSRNNCNAIIETATNELISGCNNTIIPSSVTSIGGHAFYGSGLTSISIPSSVTSIGDCAFSDCKGLTSISIPSSVTSIGDCAFSSSNLTSISIPSSVISIGWGAFSGCYRLTSISIPSSVTSIGHSAFSSCVGLTTITVDVDNPVYDSRNNCNAIIETATNELIYGCKNTVIPSSVTSIGDGAFSGFFSLTNISIPSSVTSIGNSAFSSCPRLTSVTCKSSTPPSLGEYVFWDTPTSTLYVPVGSRSAYSSTSGWSEFDNIVEVKPDHVVSTTDVILVKDGQTWLAVSLENKKDILGFQFDLTLPSGIVVNTDADGNLVSKLGDRCSDFTQTFTYIGDNKYRVTCLSMEGAAVTGHDGELMRICLTSDREVEPGDYDIVLSNIELTTTEGTATVTIYPEDYNSKLTLLNYALGDVDGNGSITVTDAVMVVQHILYKTPSNFILETADVNTDGIINVGDVVSILDLISSTSNSKSVSLKALEAE